jgi:hypothetical protein
MQLCSNIGHRRQAKQVAVQVLELHPHSRDAVCFRLLLISDILDIDNGSLLTRMSHVQESASSISLNSHIFRSRQPR